MLVMIMCEVINNVIKYVNVLKVYGKLKIVNNYKLLFMIEDDGKGIDSDCEVKSIL